MTVGNAATLTLQTTPARIPPRLLALLGEHIATSASTLSASLPAADAMGRETVAGLDRLGVQLQQAVRIVTQESAAVSEPVDLLAACRQAAAGWQAAADTSSVRLQVSGSPLTAAVNAAALEQTLDMLIEHGLDCGERVTLGVSSQGAPLRPTVRVIITRRHLPVLDGWSPPREVDGLLPLLALWLAQGSGLQIEASRAGLLVSWVLSAPAPVPEGLSLDDGSLLPRTPLAVGRRILIVDPNTASRLKAHQLLNEAGMFADAVENVPQARAALRDGPPDVLISGTPAQEPEMAGLVDDMRVACPTLRVIELVDAENAFAFSMPGADAPGRLSRDELEAHLTMAVSEEVYGARPG